MKELKVRRSTPKASTPRSNRTYVPVLQTILIPLSVPLLSVFLLFCNVADWSVWVVVATRSQYVARVLQREPEKEQPTLVTMATHLLGVLRQLILPETRFPLWDWTRSLPLGRPRPPGSSALLSDVIWLCPLHTGQFQSGFIIWAWQFAVCWVDPIHIVWYHSWLTPIKYSNESSSNVFLVSVENLVCLCSCKIFR